MAACPRRAISKDDVTGIVSIDQELCIGCGLCAKACPWDAPVVVPQIDGTRTSRKCDLCADLLAVGEEPACVAACLMRCLKVVSFDVAADACADKAGDPLIASAPELGPHYVFTPHRERVLHPDAAIRVHSMPEEYING